MPRRGITGSNGSSAFIFLRIIICNSSFETFFKSYFKEHILVPDEYKFSVNFTVNYKLTLLALL